MIRVGAGRGWSGTSWVGSRQVRDDLEGSDSVWNKSRCTVVVWVRLGMVVALRGGQFRSG